MRIEGRDYKVADGIEQIICRPYCSFYKGGKEEMLCICAYILGKILKSEKRDKVIALLSSAGPSERVYYQNGIFLEKLCRHCEFYISGCDFTDPDFKGYSPPCGGYIAIVEILKAGSVTLGEILVLFV